jgi:hypothetical protein
MNLVWQGNIQVFSLAIKAGGVNSYYNPFNPFAILPNLWCCRPCLEMVADSKMAVWQFAPPPQTDHFKIKNCGKVNCLPDLMKKMGISTTHTHG